MLPSTVALFSAAVPCARLFDAYLARSARMSIAANRPLGSKITVPFGFAPKTSAETSVQAPTRSFADCAAAWLVDSTSPELMTITLARMSRRFMMFLQHYALLRGRVYEGAELTLGPHR